MDCWIWIFGFLDFHVFGYSKNKNSTPFKSFYGNSLSSFLNNINVLIKNILEVLKDLSNKEVIVVDDNSPDGTYLFCKKEFEKNNQIKLILRQNNRGLANSIGEGIKASKGRFRRRWMSCNK